jgi:hypothetical protein
MNERIQELAWSIGIAGKNLQGQIDTDWNQIEKFAELLIRECINIAYEYDKPKLSGPGLAIASNIESHFDIYIEEDGRFVK